MRIVPYRDENFENIKDIFFLSAASPPEGAKEREAFFQRWTDYYFANERANILVAWLGDRVAGYLMGCMDSAAAEAEISKRIQSYTVFADLFAEFPAHLHMNCHPDFRGQGVGGLLIEQFARQAKQGVHIVTSPSSRNTAFYRRHGFTNEVWRPFRAAQLLFMGRRL